jgi:hypothetical protein
LKIKFVDSRANVHILASTRVPFTCTHDGASAKFSTNSHETDNSVAVLRVEAEGRSHTLPMEYSYRFSYFLKRNITGVRRSHGFLVKNGLCFFRSN